MTFILIKEAQILCLDIYKIKYPKDETYSLQSQTRRAALSILLNLAEGNVFDTKQKRHFFMISYGSVKELEQCIYLSKEMNMINESDHKEIKNKLDRIGGMIYSITNRLSELRTPNSEL